MVCERCGGVGNELPPRHTDCTALIALTNRCQACELLHGGTGPAHVIGDFEVGRQLCIGGGLSIQAITRTHQSITFLFPAYLDLYDVILSFWCEVETSDGKSKRGSTRAETTPAPCVGRTRASRCDAFRRQGVSKTSIRDGHVTMGSRVNLDLQRQLFARSERVKGIDFHPTEPWVCHTLSHPEGSPRHPFKGSDCERADMSRFSQHYTADTSTSGPTTPNPSSRPSNSPTSPCAPAASSPARIG